MNPSAKNTARNRAQLHITLVRKFEKKIKKEEEKSKMTSDNNK